MACSMAPLRSWKCLLWTLPPGGSFGRLMLFLELPDKNSQSVNRGVVYWAGSSDERILFTIGPKLYALNAQTGKTDC